MGLSEGKLEVERLTLALCVLMLELTVVIASSGGGLHD